MESNFVTEILFLHSQGYSVKRISKELNMYWGRVSKILSTNGIIINETHRKILELRKDGVPVDKIADILNISKKTVDRYLPAVRPTYKINRSENAIRILLCRERKRMKENKDK